MSIHSLLQRVAATLAVAALVVLTGLAGLSYAHEDGMSSSSSGEISSSSSSGMSSSSSGMSSSSSGENSSSSSETSSTEDGN